MAGRKGCQTPTKSVVLPHETSRGKEAIDIYEESGRGAIEWQSRLTEYIMSVREDGLWTHQKFGFSVPRRNGKNEIITIRELWGLHHGENMCHTAHRTTTSHSAWERLRRILVDSGYVELGRSKKNEAIPEKSFKLTKQYGLESISLTNGGEVVFRTRTPNGGLGEGFDLLVIDEAQEYTDAQADALSYTVSDSRNPQTLFCGTPPTEVSSGTVFLKMREQVLSGQSYETGWAEWSMDEITEDVWNVESWYATNPSMGFHLDERKIRSEIRKGKEMDFNIQRLGVWVKYNQKSAITEMEWKHLQIPRESVSKSLKKGIFCGIKYGHDGINVAVSIAAKMENGKIFVETLACRPTREGTMWIIVLLKKLSPVKVMIDGANGQNLLADDMKENKLKAPELAKIGDIVSASAAFEQAVVQDQICHAGQKGLARIVSNSAHRPIGSAGGFGYKCILEGGDISIMESTVLAYWACREQKETKKQRIRY